MGHKSREKEDQTRPSIFIAAALAEGGATLFAGAGPLVAKSEIAQGSAAFYAPDFQRRSRAAWIVPERFESYAIDSQRPLRSLPISVPFVPLDRVVVEDEVRGLINRIGQGELQKIVPVWFEQSAWVPADGESDTLFLNALSHVGAGRFPYGIFGQSEGIVGVSPEVLFQVDTAGTLRTMALAGSHRIIPGASAADLLADRKERGEHTLVIDFIRGALADLGSVDIGETVVREVPGLRHLYTPISVHAKATLDFEDLVTRLHPTPALGAVPPEVGLAWLYNRENRMPRGRHGAPFGLVLPSGEMLCLVGIRNLQWTGGGSMIGAGCGIVADSTPEREYREATAKITSVKTMLGIPS